MQVKLYAKRFRNFFLALLVKDQSSLCDTLLSVVRPSVCPYTTVCSSISSVTKYRRDLFMFSCCSTHGLVLHVQFWSSPDPHKKTLSKKKILSMCLRCLIIVLFCRVLGLDVQCTSLVKSNCSGGSEGHSLTPPPPPLSVVCDRIKKLFLDKPNALK